MIIINQPYKHTVGIIYKKGIVVNNTHKTSDSKNRYKSRYWVKCKAIYSWQCNCPNNVKHKIILSFGAGLQKVLRNIRISKLFPMIWKVTFLMILIQNVC